MSIGATRSAERAPFDPGDIVVVGPDEPVDVAPQVSRGEHRPHCRLGVVPGAAAGPGERAEIRLEPLETGAGEGEHVAEVAARPADEPFLGATDQGLLEPLRQPGDVVDGAGARPRAPREGGTGRGGDGAEPPGPNRHAETLGHDLLERVSLVDDEHVVGRQHRAVARDVGAEQMEVHDDDIRRLRRRPGPLGEALGSRRATEGAGALVRRHAQRGPQLLVRFGLELGPVTRRGPLGPGEDLPDLRRPLAGRRVVGPEHALGPGETGLAEPLEAEIVGAAFQHA